MNTEQIKNAVKDAYSWLRDDGTTDFEKSPNPIWTEALAAAIPRKCDDDDPVAYYHYFYVLGGDWYVFEARKLPKDDVLFYGYVNLGFGGECGDFTLSQLRELTQPGGFRVELDAHFTPKRLSELTR